MGERGARLAVAGALLLAAVLSGCATSYKALGRGTGYSEEKLSEESYLVSFSGNRYTDGKMVGKYLLYRCAELASSLGYEHFAVVSRDEKIHSFLVGKGVSGSVGFYRQVQAQPIERRKVTRSAVIVLSKEPLEGRGGEAFEVADVIADLKPDVLPGY